MKEPISPLGLAARGFAMGIAEVIPGVSGGTIAFISGIYTTLLDAIQSLLSPKPFRAFRSGGWKALSDAIHAPFLLFLLLGMIGGLVLGVFVITHLMENHPIPLWSFFFGLILVSTWSVGRQVPNWKLSTILLFVAGTGLAYVYTVVAPTQGIEAWWFVFFCGIIAISALMLPGISGSFILLLLGMYSYIVGSLRTLLVDFNTNSLLILLVFGSGCLIGLATFSRFLSWLFRVVPDQTLALLAGLMLGSLNKVWPWKSVVSWRIDSQGGEVPLLERSVSPFHPAINNPQLMLALSLMLTGALLMLVFDRMDRDKSKL